MFKPVVHDFLEIVAPRTLGRSAYASGNGLVLSRKSRPLLSCWGSTPGGGTFGHLQCVGLAHDRGVGELGRPGDLGPGGRGGKCRGLRGRGGSLNITLCVTVILLLSRRLRWWFTGLRGA